MSIQLIKKYVLRYHFIALSFYRTYFGFCINEPTYFFKFDTVLKCMCKAHVTYNILAHNIAIKKGKDIFFHQNIVVTFQFFFKLH